MSGILPFGETAERLLAGADGDDFAFLALADHLDEAGLGDLARVIRDGNHFAFRMIHKFLTESEFDPSRMRLVVQFRRKGRFHDDPRWLRYRTFYTRTRFPGIRVAFYRENPTPNFLDPFSADPVRPRTRRSRP